MYSLSLKKTIFVLTMAVVSTQLSACFGGGGGSATEPPPAVTTWENLIWDDGSNDPNTLWED